MPGQDWCLGTHRVYHYVTMCCQSGGSKAGGGLGAAVLAAGAASDAGVAQVLGAALSGDRLEGFQLQLFLGVLQHD